MESLSEAERIILILIKDDVKYQIQQFTIDSNFSFKFCKYFDLQEQY